jgi:hypothetical protein
MEQWKPIFDGYYAVSNLGRVKRLIAVGHGSRAGRILSPSFNSTYPCVRISIGGNYKNWRLHDLVLLGFVGPKPKGSHVNHKNGNKQNNTPANLEYTSQKQNNRHAYSTHLLPSGERHHFAKLTLKDVRQILRRSKRESVQCLAYEYGVTVRHIRRIIRGERWKWER